MGYGVARLEEDAMAGFFDQRACNDKPPDTRKLLPHGPTTAYTITSPDRWERQALPNPN